MSGRFTAGILAFFPSLAAYFHYFSITVHMRPIGTGSITLYLLPQVSFFARRMAHIFLSRLEVQSRLLCLGLRTKCFVFQSAHSKKKMPTSDVCIVMGRCILIQLLYWHRLSTGLPSGIAALRFTPTYPCPEPP